jgi:hypothetical protein
MMGFHFSQLLIKFMNETSVQGARLSACHTYFPFPDLFYSSMFILIQFDFKLPDLAHAACAICSKILVFSALL